MKILFFSLRWSLRLVKVEEREVEVGEKEILLLGNPPSEKDNFNNFLPKKLFLYLRLLLTHSLIDVFSWLKVKIFQIMLFISKIKRFKSDVVSFQVR